jgi:transglutaminase-like putative cysteine protease
MNIPVMKILTFKNLYLLIFSLITFPVFSQDDFSVARIDPVLLADANAVIRLDESNWEIISKGEAKQHNRLVVTILNEKGEERHNQLIVRYDKFTKITDISGILYDAGGKMIKKLKNADIKDYGYGSGGDDITDARVKVADFGRKSYAYPYTIEYSYDLRDRNMMFYPRWTVARNSESSVEHCTYMIKAPAGFQFRYKEYNEAPAAVTKKDADGSDLYIWKIDNRPAVKTTDFYPLPLIESAMMILAAPSDFEIQDYQGSFSSWEDLSKFYYTLNAGRDVLPAAIQAEIKELVKNAKSDREKILLIYKWMQGRTRYVSIQLGIGGWQTIDATTVANKGYGDCKALTNFTLAALRHVGVPAYAALIRAGEEQKIKPDFPSSQFNHVIACAMAGKDTVWLECTSQTTPPNFMGTFTGSRHALLVMPQGGRLVQTPDYKPSQNVRQSNSRIKLEATGDGQVQVRTVYSGLRQESRSRILHNSSGDEQKKWITSQVNLPSLDLESFELWKQKKASRCSQRNCRCR